MEQDPDLPAEWEDILDRVADLIPIRHQRSELRMLRRLIFRWMVRAHPAGWAPKACGREDRVKACLSLGPVDAVVSQMHAVNVSSVHRCCECCRTGCVRQVRTASVGSMRMHIHSADVADACRVCLFRMRSVAGVYVHMYI